MPSRPILFQCLEWIEVVGQSIAKSTGRQYFLGRRPRPTRQRHPHRHGTATRGGHTGILRGKGRHWSISDELLWRYNRVRNSRISPSKNGNGGTSDEDGFLGLFPPQTPPTNSLLGIKGPGSCTTTLAPPVSQPQHRHPSRHLARSSIITRSLGGDLGGYSQGCTKEEDIAHEEETQTNGRQGYQGRNGALRLPGVWWDEAYALCLPYLRIK